MIYKIQAIAIRTINLLETSLPLSINHVSFTNLTTYSTVIILMIKVIIIIYYKIQLKNTDIWSPIGQVKKNIYLQAFFSLFQPIGDEFYDRFPRDLANWFLVRRDSGCSVISSGNDCWLSGHILIVLTHF